MLVLIKSFLILSVALPYRILACSGFLVCCLLLGILVVCGRTMGWGFHKSRLSNIVKGAYKAKYEVLMCE